MTGLAIEIGTLIQTELNVLMFREQDNSYAKKLLLDAQNKANYSRLLGECYLVS